MEKFSFLVCSSDKLLHCMHCTYYVLINHNLKIFVLYRSILILLYASTLIERLKYTYIYLVAIID